MNIKKCEDCALKQPSYGLPGEGKKQRWCTSCAKAHPGAVNKRSNKCEDCMQKAVNYGLSGEGKKQRWCAGCAKAHGGVRR